MKYQLRNTLAALSALALAASFTGCGSSKSSKSGSESTTASQTSSGIVGQYGANMIKHLSTDGYEITAEVDYRFVTEDESKKLAKYIAAIGRSDGKLMEEALYPAALDYVVKANSCSDAEDYAKKLHQQLLQFTGEEYEFEYTVVEEYAGENDMDFSKYDEIVLDADPDAQITDRKRLSVDALYDGTNKSINYRMGGYIDVYMYTINGEPYVLS